MITQMNIKLVFYDFDGVMTDNKAYLSENGDESVKINRSDGLGVSLISNLGIKQIILSTEKNRIVKKRANKLKIGCFSNLKDKASKAREITKKLKIDLEDCCFIGNDLNDLEIMKLVGMAICPADAAKEIKQISKLILKSSGGEGVIREFFDHINKK